MKTKLRGDLHQGLLLMRIGIVYTLPSWNGKVFPIRLEQIPDIK